MKEISPELALFLNSGLAVEGGFPGVTELIVLVLLSQVRNEQ